MTRIEERTEIRVPRRMFGGSGWYETSASGERDRVHHDGRQTFVWQNRKEGPIRRSWYQHWPRRGGDGPLGIVRPFRFDGQLYFTHGLMLGPAGAERQADCAPLVPADEFTGRVWESPSEKYHHNESIDEFVGDFARNDPMGFFYGVRAEIKGQADWIVGGPEVLFIEQPAGQLVMF